MVNFPKRFQKKAQPYGHHFHWDSKTWVPLRVKSLPKSFEPHSDWDPETTEDTGLIKNKTNNPRGYIAVKLLKKFDTAGSWKARLLNNTVKTKSKTKEDIKFIWDPYHEKESTLTTWYIRERTNDPKFFMVEKPLHSERGAGPKAGMALLTWEKNTRYFKGLKSKEVQYNDLKNLFEHGDLPGEGQVKGG